MGIEEAGRAKAHIAAVAAKALGIIVLLDMGDDAVDPVQHPVDVDFRIAGRQTELRGLAHPVREPRGIEERLAGYAAAVQAVAAEMFRFFDQRHPQTQLRGNARDDQPARAAADHHHILFSGHWPSLLPCDHNYVWTPHSGKQVLGILRLVFTFVADARRRERTLNDLDARPAPWACSLRCRRQARAPGTP